MKENPTFGLAFNISVWVVFVVFATLLVMSCHAMNKTPMLFLFLFYFILGLKVWSFRWCWVQTPDNVFQSSQESCSYLCHSSEWVSEWINVVKSVRTAAHREREKERENKFGNGSVDWKSKESWISVTHYQDWNLDTAKVNGQVDNCPIWIQIGFVLFWDSSRVYDYSSTVVIVFVCEWMCVSYLCNFSQGRDWQEKEQSVCVCVRERERERERESCHTLFHPATTARWNMTSADEDNAIKLNFPFLEHLHLRSFISHMMSLLNLWMHLPLPQHPLWYFLVLFFYYPQKKEKNIVALG